MKRGRWRRLMLGDEDEKRERRKMEKMKRERNIEMKMTNMSKEEKQET